MLNNKNEAEPASLHEWRKRVKYAWYHFRLLQPFWPEVWKGYSREWHALSHFLGGIQDVSVLEDKIVKDENVSEETEQEMLLKSLLQTERTELLNKALGLTNKLFAEKPGHFKNRIEGVVAGTEE